MPLRLERRPQPSTAMVYAAPLIAVGATVIVALVIFAAAGHAPLDALVMFVTGPVQDRYGVGEWLLKATPLILIAVGLTVGFRAGVWNVGAEGQLILGVIASGWLALKFGPGGSPLLLPAMIVAGGLAGAAWAAIPALLRTRFNANEILVSLMFNYVAQLWLSWLVFGMWRDPAGFNFPQSEPLAPAALYPIILEDTRLNIGLWIALAAVLAGWVLLSRSYIGFQLKVTGLSDAAARYAGFSTRRAVWLGMLAGGLTAGIAGVGEIAGPLGQIFPTASPGYGYAAIIVAFLGRLHPIGIVFSGLLLSLLYLSGDTAQMSLGLPSSITGLFQGMMLFFLLAADVLIFYRIRRRPAAAPAAAPVASATIAEAAP
ncbi:ABC transporter permease [Methylobrevis albus]|uniref:ABC transporter permease n=1 Tax=Methylobrevis albus TaxID=2793297 RepID=A0A931MYE1_9HYPH|nr:ABC transporter permease [Methylobrevis albus]MBH0236621.1 ABC transporter permease [Methylobrevis albus]